MIKKKEGNERKSNIWVFLIYLYGFFIIYSPRVSDLYLGIPIEYVTTFILGLLIFPYILFKFPRFKRVYLNKKLVFLYFGIFLSSCYFAFIASLTGNEIRILQNNFILVQIIHAIIIIDVLKMLGYTKDGMIKFLLNLALIQGIICIIMVIIPEFKNIALNLYYLGREENIFISRMRIYGISGDYTFFTPIYHGLLAAVAAIYAVLKSNKYLIYIPFILIAIILNGRFGLGVFIVGTFVGYLWLFMKRKQRLKIIQYTATFFIVLGIAIYLLKIINPYTYAWIQSGFESTVNLIMHGELEDNYKYLAGSHAYLPDGVSLIVGEGHRVYAEHGTSRGYNSSDIGYVNDLFMGGIIYIIILYGSVFIFVLNKFNRKVNNDADYYINKILPIILIITLILSNYKGETMRGGLILFASIFIKLALSHEDSSSLRNHDCHKEGKYV